MNKSLNKGKFEERNETIVPHLRQRPNISHVFEAN